ncbi:MAG: branched-chain amino acid ABC transporter permease [Chloroflexi bacterium]|nr:branched-chain amino acid ABC transporter permease [Chloroflexota bacterium]
MDIRLLLSSPEIILDTLVIGITNGSLIALIALGYTLVYGIIELINFAHGEIFMLGSAVSLSILLGLGASRQWPAAQLVLVMLAAVLVAMVICAVLNASIERLAYRRLRSAPRLAALISAIGASFILQNVGLAWLGANPRDFPDLLPAQNIFRDILGIQTTIGLSTKDVIVLLLTIPLMVGLQRFVSSTRLGKAMRATAQDREAASLMGIDINLTITLTFLLGGALAGAAGLLFGLYSNYTSWQIGFRAGLQAFTAAVLGGIGNIGGAVLGAFLIGILGAFSDILLDSRWTQVVIFSILIVILVFKPSGLTGTATTEKV